MRPTITFTISLLLATSPLWAVDNPNVQSPIGSPTAVPSASRSGLIPNRPFDVSGSNDIVTGNVGGLRHFRGTLPYSSSYYSGTSAYSPADDFLRRSYDPIAQDRNPGLTRPYYDPRRTMTSVVRADGSGLFSPTITQQGQIDPYTPPMLAQTFDTQYRQRPLSLSGSELERLMSRQMQLREEMEQLPPTRDGQETTIVEEVRSETPFFQDYLRTEELTSPEETEISESPKPDPLPEELVLEAFQEELREQMLEDSPQRTAELLRPHTAGPEDAAPQAELTPEEAALKAAEKAQAAALLSRYGNLEEMAKARVTEYLTAAEDFLKKGKFYKAADAFALAAIWGPDDVRPYVGQAVALVAAGEYMSSAFLLRQAIVKNPKVAAEKISIATLLGDRDVFENRLIEMATWQQRSGSGDLAFLIAYVMHHDGKTRGAAEAISIAAQKMPEDKAVLILKQIIIPDTAAQ